MQTTLQLALVVALTAAPAYSQQYLSADVSPEVSHEVRAVDLRASIRASVGSVGEVHRLEVRGLVPRARPVTWPSRQQVRDNWIQRHPKLFGALVGFGVGCPLGAIQVGGSQDDFFNALDEFACPFLGGVGAAAGAAIGAAVAR